MEFRSTLLTSPHSSSSRLTQAPPLCTSLRTPLDSRSLASHPKYGAEESKVPFASCLALSVCHQAPCHTSPVQQESQGHYPCCTDLPTLGGDLWGHRSVGILTHLWWSPWRPWASALYLPHPAAMSWKFGDLISHLCQIAALLWCQHGWWWVWRLVVQTWVTGGVAWVVAG